MTFMADLLSARGRTALSPCALMGHRDESGRRRARQALGAAAVYGGLVAKSLMRMFPLMPVWCMGARFGSRSPGTVRSERVPLCDFPLGPHRETAGCGMLAITFVHFPGRFGRGCPYRGGAVGPVGGGVCGTREGYRTTDVCGMCRYGWM
ncbi:hypothetical protein GCM10027073_08450 [Streptomyces chlorus]